LRGAATTSGETSPTNGEPLPLGGEEFASGLKKGEDSKNAQESMGKPGIV